MKLTLNRREAQEEKLFKTVTVYYLDVNIEATPEEVALLRKGWDRPLCGGLFRGDSGMRWNASEVVGKPKSWGFDRVTDRASIEDQLIKNTKSLEKQLAEVAASAAGPPPPPPLPPPPKPQSGSGYCSNCGHVRPAKVDFCAECGARFAAPPPPVHSSPSPPPPTSGGTEVAAVTPDFKQQLAELYQRVVEDELGFLTTIDESGYVNFEQPEGAPRVYISLDEGIPEYMGLHCLFYKGEIGTLADLMRICNSVNSSSLVGVLTVDDTCFVVDAHVQLFLAEHGRMPEEALLRAVIGRAMSSIKDVAEKFATEIKNLAP